jgi:hypothetical protein
MFIVQQYHSVTETWLMIARNERVLERPSEGGGKEQEAAASRSASFRLDHHAGSPLTSNPSFPTLVLGIEPNYMLI